jgi:hypothetical protein
MSTLPTAFPFSRLRLGGDREVLRWTGYNPTFHRFSAYGLVVTDAALYLCPPGWLFARWTRYPLADISGVALSDVSGRPALEFQSHGKRIVFRPRWDSHKEEVEFDRRWEWLFGARPATG